MSFPNDSELLRLIEAGDEAGLRLALLRHDPERFHLNAALLCIDLGRMDCLAQLIRPRLIPAQIDAFRHAALGGHETATRLFLATGACHPQANATLQADAVGTLTPIQWAATTGETGVLKELLLALKTPAYPPTGPLGETAVHAAQGGHAACSELLWPELEPAERLSCFQSALLFSNPELSAWMLERLDPRHSGRRGRGAAHCLAIAAGGARLSFGATLIAVPSPERREAMRQAYETLAARAMELGHGLDADELGKTPMAWAEQGKNPWLADILMASFERRGLAQEIGLTPAHPSPSPARPPRSL